MSQFVSAEFERDLRKMAEIFTDPEEINSDYPPSKRIIDLFMKHEQITYKKKAYGVVLALEIGMTSILANCPRFANWVHSVAQRAIAP